LFRFDFRIDRRKAKINEWNWKSKERAFMSHPNVKKSSKPRPLQDTFNDLLYNIQKPLAIHHIASIPLLASGIWRNFLLLLWRGSDRTGLKRRKDATSHIILDNLYLGEKGFTLKEFSIQMLKSHLNQERYKILLMIYFLIYRNFLEFITFVQSYFHYL
jgi:hypothetical protein